MSVIQDPAARRKIIDLLNEVFSCEHHSFVAHLLGSNPYLPAGTEGDLSVLQDLRNEELAAAKSLLVHMGRYRAGPTIKVFQYWKEDLNFLGLDWMVTRAAGAARDAEERVERVRGLLPPGDGDLQATFESLLEMRKRHRGELEKLAATRQPP